DAGLRTAFRRTGPRTFSGYVVNESDPARKFVVDILVDGYPIKVVRADAYVHELAAARIGDGCFGFSFSLSEGALSDSSIVEARVANLRDSIGRPIALDQPFAPKAPSSTPGGVRWLGGLRFSGWIAGSKELASADILVDGILVARVRASAWSHAGASDEGARAVGAFDFHLPERFADGAVHQLQAIDEKDNSLDGSPLAFLAFANGLSETLLAGGASEANRTRAELFNQLMPLSTPMSDYQGWRGRLPVAPGPLGALRGAVIAVGAGAMDETLASLNEQTPAHWIAASLPPTAEPTGFRDADLQGFLRGDGAECDFVLFTLSGTVLAPSALQRIAGAFQQFGEARAVYGDLDVQSAAGSTWPLAFSSFDYERTLEQGYCAYLFALRRAAALHAPPGEVSNLYRLFNSLLDGKANSPLDIVHLPVPLGTLPSFDRDAAAQDLANASRAFLRRKGVGASVTTCRGGAFPAVRVARSIEPLRTTIIIPTRNQRQLLEGCIDSIRPAVERRNAEIIVVDNESSDPDTLDYLSAIDKRIATILRVPGAFNFARLNNRAAEAAGGEILCLLNDDVSALDHLWLDEMLSRIAEGDVGAVGALLLWPSGVVQHGGVVLGPKFEAAHAFRDRIDGDAGYGDLLRVAHECSAVTAACLMTRRRDYLEVGGMDEAHFPVNFNDVDYCLKLRARKRRIVFTPHAKLMHRESASRGLDHSLDRRPRLERELRNLRAKWGSVLAADPYYSPILGLDPNPFSALAWPVRDIGPRVNRPPLENPLPAWL
ncbi:MAG: glycosyltransferase family 2 protein, partial [Roseiarcus sp.]